MDAENALSVRREHGLDQPPDEEIVPRRDEDRRQDDEREGDDKRALRVGFGR